MSIRTGVEDFWPEKAEKELDRASERVKNRNVSDQHVGWLAAQMKDRKWDINGEPLIFDEDGVLMDGQHRLWAVINSGMRIKMLVVRGVARKLFATIDTGKARTIGNVMNIHGEKNGNHMSASLGWLHRYNTGKMLWTPKSAGMTGPIALSLLRKHPEMRNALAWAHSAGKTPYFKGRVSMSALTFLRFMFASHKPQKAAEFFDLVLEDRSDTQGSPTRVLRHWLLRKDTVRRTKKITTTETMAIFVKAWAAFLNGVRPTRYTWTRRGDNPENFPTFPGDRESAGKALKIVKKTKKPKKKSA